MSKMVRSTLFLAVLIVWAAKASAATGYLDEPARMRAGPDRAYPVVDIIRPGEEVEIYSCLSDWSWCDVSFEDQRGWVRAEKIKADSDDGRVPLTDRAEDLGIATRGYNLDEYWDTHYHGRFDNNRGRWQSYYRRHHREDWDRDSDR